MQRLQALVRSQFTLILLLLLAGGFLTILAELLLTDHVDGIQKVGVIASVVGLGLVIAGIFARRGLRVALAILLALLSVSGLIGTLEHLKERGEDRAGGDSVAAAWRPVGFSSEKIGFSADELNPSDDDDGDSGESASGSSLDGSEGEAEVPPLAPLGLSGLALMGAVVLLAREDG